MIWRRFNVRSLLLVILLAALLLGAEATRRRWRTRSEKFQKRALQLSTTATYLRDRGVEQERRAGVVGARDSAANLTRSKSLKRQAEALEARAAAYRQAARRPWRSVLPPLPTGD